MVPRRSLASLRDTHPFALISPNLWEQCACKCLGAGFERLEGANGVLAVAAYSRILRGLETAETGFLGLGRKQVGSGWGRSEVGWGRKGTWVGIVDQ